MRVLTKRSGQGKMLGGGAISSTGNEGLGRNSTEYPNYVCQLAETVTIGGQLVETVTVSWSGAQRVTPTSQVRANPVPVQSQNPSQLAGSRASRLSALRERDQLARSVRIRSTSPVSYL